MLVKSSLQLLLLLCFSLWLTLRTYLRRPRRLLPCPCPCRPSARSTPSVHSTAYSSSVWLQRSVDWTARTSRCPCWQHCATTIRFPRCAPVTAATKPANWSTCLMSSSGARWAWAMPERWLDPSVGTARTLTSIRPCACSTMSYWVTMTCRMRHLLHLRPRHCRWTTQSMLPCSTELSSCITTRTAATAVVAAWRCYRMVWFLAFPPRSWAEDTARTTARPSGRPRRVSASLDVDWTDHRLIQLWRVSMDTGSRKTTVIYCHVETSPLTSRVRWDCRLPTAALPRSRWIHDEAMISYAR